MSAFSVMALALQVVAFSPTDQLPEKTSSGSNKGRKSHVPKGFEPDSYCQTCVTYAFDIHNRLWPKMRTIIEKRRAATERGQKYKSQMHVGGLDELGFQHFEESGCFELSIRNNATMRRACERQVEDSVDALVATVSQWAQSSSEPTLAELTAMMCSVDIRPKGPARACTAEQLERIEPVNPRLKAAEKIKARKASGNEEAVQYMTERPPNPADNTGPVYKVVGENLNATISEDRDADLLVYFYWQGKYDFDNGPGKWVVNPTHAALGPRVERIALLLASLPRHPRTLKFAKIDCARNELPPPWDVIQSPTLVHFHAGRAPIILTGVDGPSGRKTSFGEMSVLELLEPLPQPLNVVLSQLVHDLKDRHAQSHVSNLMAHLGDERLAGAQGQGEWWDDDEILARARQPYDELPPPAPPQGGGGAKKAKKKKRQTKARKKDDLPGWQHDEV